MPDVRQVIYTFTLPDLVADVGDASSGFQGSLYDILRQQPQYIDFWSEPPQATLTIPAVAADLALPDVVVASLPAGITILRVVAGYKFGKRRDTSAAQNQIGAAGKTLRIKTAAGAWPGTVAMTFALNQLRTEASGVEGGDAGWANTDLSAVVVGDGTYNFASRETGSADALVATGASLILYDIQMGLRVYYLLV